jgi:predicted AlkP superfamily pyrophosphatase or phosphodiesterase
MSMFRILTLATLLFASLAVAQFTNNSRTPLILVSIDGLRPDYLLKADEHGLKIPNLRTLLKEGAHATGVKGVLPTITYPSHTTILTGVWPSKHGIFGNETFDPEGKNKAGWYWYSEDIKAPTLWDVAARSGYVVGSVSWPVSVGAPGVRFLIPEYWRAGTPEDLKLLRAISTPGLFSELQRTSGQYTTNLNEALPGDWGRTRYAAALIKEKHVNFLTFHFAALDHLEHEGGPFSQASNATLEEIDKMVGILTDAVREHDRNGYVCIVSDHGFSPVTHTVNLVGAFARARLITLKPQKGDSATVSVAAWKAVPWLAGGSAAIILKDPANEAVRTSVNQLLDHLAADPKNGIAQVLDRNAIAKLGGATTADFWVDMKPGFAVGTGAPTDPIVRDVSLRGTHGYSPIHPELRAFFLLAGRSVRPGADLGDIDMRSIAPTLARTMGFAFPTADLPPLDVLAPGPNVRN